MPKIKNVVIEAISEAAKVEKSGWINAKWEGGIDGQPNKWQTAIEIVFDERNKVENEARERMAKRNGR